MSGREHLNASGYSSLNGTNYEVYNLMKYGKRPRLQVEINETINESFASESDTEIYPWKSNTTQK